MNSRHQQHPCGELTLTVVRGGREGETLRFSQDALLIGTDASCALRLEDRGVSRKHCQVLFRDGRWMLRDLGSTNGTLVNQKLVHSTDATRKRSKVIRLHVNDLITVGAACIQVESMTVHRNGSATEKLDLADVHPRGANSEATIQAKEQTEAPKALQSPLPVQAELSTTLAAEAIALSFQLPGYRVVELIAQGGMGDVFLAESANATGQRVAVKLLRSAREDAQDRQRFLRELEIAKLLEHPAIVHCIEVGVIHGRDFMIMEFCSAGSLADLLKRSGKLTPRRAVRLALRLLGGLAHAHEQGIVHRDLKPSNVLLNRLDTGKFQPKISDFGLAKNHFNAGRSQLTVQGEVGGTLTYMPREQLLDYRFVSPPSDIWSFGAMVYECMTGRLPRPMPQGVDPVHVILESKVLPITADDGNIPAPIAEVVMKSLSLKPEARFSCAAEMRTALQLAAEQSGIGH